MTQEKFSINEIRDRYEAEDFELSAPLNVTITPEVTIRMRLSIYKGQTDESESGYTGLNGLQLNFEDANGQELDIEGLFLDSTIGIDWTPDTVAETFKIPLDAKVWEVNDIDG
jgi:hypothetical protein